MSWGTAFVNVSKGGAFILGVALISVFGILETIFPGRNTQIVPIIQTIAMLTGGYIGLQVANNGVRGLTYNADLYKAENPPETDPEGRKNDGEK